MRVRVHRAQPGDPAEPLPPMPERIDHLASFWDRIHHDSQMTSFLALCPPAVYRSYTHFSTGLAHIIHDASSRTRGKGASRRAWGRAGAIWSRHARSTARRIMSAMFVDAAESVRPAVSSGKHSHEGPRRTETVRRGAHGAKNNERHVCARRRVGEVAGPERRARPPHQASLEPPRSSIAAERFVATDLISS